MAILQKTGITGSLSISSSGIRPTTSASLFNVNGYNGRLLSVVDTLSGSLFSVNSIAGLPIFEVFSNNRVVAGKYAANDFVISGSRVGIGTSSPTGMFEIYKSTPGGLGGTLILNNDGTIVANETAIIFGDGNVNNRRAAISSTTEGSPFYGDIKFKTGLSAYGSLNTRMIILGNGNVGIGTTSPSSLLNIRASVPTSTGTVTTGTNLLIDSNTSNYITFRNTGDNATYAGLTFLDNNTGGYVVFRNYASNDVIGGSDCMIYGTYQDHIFQNGTSETINGKIETLRIKQNGSVGIGANSPSAKLHISSSTTTALRIETKVGSGTDTQIEYVGPDTHSYAIGIDNSDGNKFKISYAASRTPPNLGTNDRFVIQTDGKIGIGTSVAETDLSVVDMNFGRVGIGTVTYYGVWLTGGTSATDFSFLSSPSDTNLYLNAPSSKGIYNQINNTNILSILGTSIATSVPLGIAMSPSYTLDVTGTLRTSGDVGLGGAPDTGARLYVQGESLTEPFLSVQTCLGNNSNSTATYNTLKGYLAVKIGNNVGSGTALITAGTYYLRLWGGV